MGPAWVAGIPVASQGVHCREERSQTPQPGTLVWDSGLPRKSLVHLNTHPPDVNLLYRYISQKCKTCYQGVQLKMHHHTVCKAGVTGEPSHLCPAPLERTARCRHLCSLCSFFVSFLVSNLFMKSQLVV